MSLLQATNIEPSVSGAGDRGSAVIDLTEGLTISWQVNGSSPMTAYQVQIFKNDAESTSMYSTGKVTLETPFYGRNGLGEPQFFSFTIPAATVESALLTNGNQYKYLITQWWGDTDAESITQSSADVFIARSKPVLTIDPIGEDTQFPTITSRSYTFTASYSQAQGDNIESVRWEMLSSLREQIADSGTIYTSVLSWNYNGFPPARVGSILVNRYIRCTVTTELGVEVTTEKWFVVNYRPSGAGGRATACCAPESPGSTKVSWPGFRSLMGTASGDGYTVGVGGLVLSGDGTTVEWSLAANTQASTLFWAGLFTSGDENVFLTVGSNLQVRLGFSPNEIVLLSTAGTTVQHIPLPDIEEQTFSVSLAFAITSTAITWRMSYKPGVSDIYKTTVGTTALSFAPGNFTSVKLSGKQVCNFVYVKQETLSRESILSLFHDWFYIPDGYVPPLPPSPSIYPRSKPEFDRKTLMLADFTHQQALEAGTLYTPIGAVKEHVVYRQEGGTQGELVYVGTTPANTQAIYDFSIPNGKNWQWYIYATGTNGETVGAMTTGLFTPFFWDWIVIRAELQTDGTYLANQVFRFGKNLSSGQIGNNNSPELLQNFTPYPTILPAPQNYQSGTLSSLIGVIDENGTYSDTIALRDAIYALSVTTDTLFLKNRKGDLMQIVISGPITMETNDASASQAQKVGLPWAEVATAEGVSIISRAAI